jgi:hypothetical protein
MTHFQENIFELPYNGSVSFWIDLIKHQDVVFDVSKSIPKKSFQNRMHIATANGFLNLSIPLSGGRDSKIAYHQIEWNQIENWKTKHLNALKCAYAKSPFFEYYIDELEVIYAKDYPFLFEFNLNLLKWISKKIQLNISFECHFENQNKIIKNYFLDKEEKNFETYPQVFRNKYEFIPNLSILDLLFNCGKRSVDYLKEY